MYLIPTHVIIKYALTHLIRPCRDSYVGNHMHGIIDAIKESMPSSLLSQGDARELGMLIDYIT